MVSIKDEASYKMKNSDYECLREIGARDPIMSEYRGSFTLVGYTGPGRPSFIRQVRSQLFITNRNFMQTVYILCNVYTMQANQATIHKSI